MYILVKNLNSRLIFVMNDEVQFNILLDELKSLLKQSFFKKEDYYPKAFFDFQCRILKEDEILAFFKVLVECQSLLFGGFVEKKTQKEQEIRMIERSIHGGEVIEINNSQASISSQVFKDATLRFFKKTIHHFTTFEMSLVYYKDDAIVIEKGDYIHV